MKRIKRLEAFTLLETLIALALTSFAFILILSLVSVHARLLKRISFENSVENSTMILKDTLDGISRESCLIEKKDSGLRLTGFDGRRYILQSVSNEVTVIREENNLISGKKVFLLTDREKAGFRIEKNGDLSVLILDLTGKNGTDSARYLIGLKRN